MLMQHVMYKDIIGNRTYVTYPYFDKFDIDDPHCLYCYRNNEHAIREYLDNVASPEYVKENVIDKMLAEYGHDLSEKEENRLYNGFSSKNPCVRLCVYGGGNIDKTKVFHDLDESHDIKHVFIELTGEINAIAMDGLFSLYASALYYLEGEEDTPNAKQIVSNYKNLIENSYIYMKRGTAMEFFFMPIADIDAATRNHDIEALMESCNRFTEVYIRNNEVKPLLV